MTLLLSLLFGSIGFGFFLYGKKQGRPVPLFCGIILMVFPYFVSNRFAMAGIGTAIIFVAYFVRV
jgi:hypothetical protein